MVNALTEDKVVIETILRLDRRLECQASSVCMNHHGGIIRAESLIFDGAVSLVCCTHGGGDMEVSRDVFFAGDCCILNFWGGKCCLALAVGRGLVETLPSYDSYIGRIATFLAMYFGNR